MTIIDYYNLLLLTAPWRGRGNCWADSNPARQSRNWSVPTGKRDTGSNHCTSVLLAKDKPNTTRETNTDRRHTHTHSSLYLKTLRLPGQMFQRHRTQLRQHRFIEVFFN